MALLYLCVVLPPLLFGFNNCGGKKSAVKSNTLFASGGGCSTISKYVIPLQISSIDRNFSEESGMDVKEVIVRSSCADAVAGEQPDTFTGAVRRADGTLYVLTNLTRADDTPYTLQFYDEQPEENSLPIVIDEFCASDTSLTSLSASGIYDPQEKNLVINLTSNVLTVESCPRQSPTL